MNVLNDCHIRLMLPTDVEAVVAIEKDSFPYPWGEAIFHDCLTAGYQCSVMTYQARVIAYAIIMIVLDESHILNIAVSPHWRKQGIAQWFLASLLQQLTQYSVHQVFLEVRESNTAAIKLYERLNFECIGLRKAYYPAEHAREDALLFTKKM